MNNIFLFGYYGFSNLGDEATLHSIVELIHTIEPKMTINVLTYNSEFTKKNYNVNAISRNQYISILQSIRKSDLIISGGGTLLQNVTSNRSLFYYLSIILIAKMCRKKVVFFSNGFGPIKLNKRITRFVCNHVDEIILRDEESKKLMQTINITKPISITADITFLLKTKSNIKVQRKIAISLRPWKLTKNFYNEMSMFVQYLISKDYAVDFIIMEKQHDIIVINELMKKLSTHKNINIFTSDNYEDIMYKIGESQLTIGMRLHANIFSLINNKPIIAIDYDPKVKALAKDFKQICLSVQNDINLNALKQSFETVMSNYNFYQRQVSYNINLKRELLNYNYKYLEEEFVQIEREYVF